MLKPSHKDHHWVDASSRGPRAVPILPNQGNLTPVLSKKTEINSREAVADIFYCAGPEAKPLRHHRQIAAQLLVALFDVVSNFAAFKCSEQGIGNPSPL